VSESTDYETSYFAEYIKAFNSQHFYGNTFMLSPQMLNTSLKVNGKKCAPCIIEEICI